MPTEQQDGSFQPNDVALVIQPYLGPQNVGKAVVLVQLVGRPNVVAMQRLRLSNKFRERVWLVEAASGLDVCLEYQAKFRLPQRITVFPIPERFLLRLGETDGPKERAHDRATPIAPPWKQ